MRTFIFLGLILILLLGTSFSGNAQELENAITMPQVEAHLRFLASDELRGRKTGEIGNWTAARYIAEQFRAFGVRSIAESVNDYYQVIPFAEITPPSQGTLMLGDLSVSIADDLLIRLASDGILEGDLIYLAHTTPEDINRKVKGKMVITHLGSEEITDPQAAFALTTTKKKKLEEMGALGLIEIYQGRHPWNLIKRFFGAGSMVIMEEGDNPAFPSMVINAPAANHMESIKSGEIKTFKLDTDGTRVSQKPSPNVVGVIEGTDPILKNEYVILSAHFDHVGTSTSSQRPANVTDSIYNGARDNALGVTALLSAAKTLSLHPPKRSILLLGLTAEEIGLVGSKYYVDNPLIPLDQMVFNLNTDGAGHSDSTIVAVIGLNRVGAAEEIEAACHAFGLDVFADPAPEQNLFDRSDNVSFAAVGIPAPTFSPGFRTFDSEIMKHYHQPSDEVDTLDFNYVLKFCRAYALAARMIADKEERPKWAEGDKYYPAFIELFGDL